MHGAFDFIARINGNRLVPRLSERVAAEGFDVGGERTRASTGAVLVLRATFFFLIFCRACAQTNTIFNTRKTSETRAPSRPTTFLFLQLTNEHHVPTNGKIICVFVSVLVC